MPSLSELSDFVELNIGTFEKGKWDFIGLAQLYPELEVLGQLVPRKTDISNYEQTVVYQTETETSGHGAKPGDPVSPVNKKNALKRKIKAVKYVDSIGWTLDQDTLQGKSDEHIVKQIQMDLVDFDLHWWQDLEHMMLRLPDNIVPADDETLFGLPAWITDDANIADDTFELYGGDNPTWSGSGTGRPGSIAVADQPKYTNPVAKFSVVSDDNLFDFVESFLMQRKLMGAVPNPRLLPDTPNDVWYTQLPLHNAIKRYLQASNENVGLDAGRYKGQPNYKGIPIMVWHALGHPDSPVRSASCESYILDWNSFAYGVQPEYDRKIEGPKDLPLVPSGKYITSEVWHQLKCDRPDRNLKLVSDTTSLQP
jgi:hypothetical protein